jgi:uncharacterized membrane protein YphA (DoxX/SURF4 family)
MDRVSSLGVIVARILVALVFPLHGFGVIDQSIPARELMKRGVPSSLVSLVMFSGRALELAARTGMFPGLSALALFAFLVPWTLGSHSFWLAAWTPAFQGQLINFFKNTAILGGLLFIAASPRQLRLFGFHAAKGENAAASIRA